MHDWDDKMTDYTIHSLSDLPGPKGVPFLGNFNQIAPETFHSDLERWAEEFGPIYQIRLLNKQYVVISDPKMGLDIVKKRPKLFNRTERLEWLFDDLGLHGVFSSNGERWKRHRRLVMPAFSYNTLRCFFPRLKAFSIRLQHAVEKSIAAETEFNIHQLLQFFTIDITTSLVCGYETKMLENGKDSVIRDQIDLLFHALNRRGKYPFPWWRYFKTAQTKKIDAAREDIYRLAVAMISKARADLTEYPHLAEEPETILQVMILASDDEDNKLTDDELFANIMTLLLAGEDTTSNMMAWTLYYLAQNPQLQTQIISEVKRICDGDIENLTFEQLEKLDLLETVLREGLRLKGTAPLISAEATEDVELLNGTRLPAGTAVFILTRLGGLDPDIVSEPARFNPERWGKNNQEQVCPHLQSSHMPFGGGARHCPGERLAIMEAKAVIARLCWYFNICRAEDAPDVGEEFALTMRPTNLALTLSVR